MIYYFIIYQLSTTEPTNVQNIPRYQQLPCGFELMTLCKFMVFIVLFISITNIVKVLIQVKYFINNLCRRYMILNSRVQYSISPPHHSKV
jgi:hypothetical protein